MKVIIYEGLFGILLGSKMSKAFEKAMPGHPYEKRSWISKKSIKKGAIVIGHSFGAYRAWERFSPGNHAHLITVDMRWWHGNKDDERYTPQQTQSLLPTKSTQGVQCEGNTWGGSKKLRFLWTHESPFTSFGY